MMMRRKAYSNHLHNRAVCICQAWWEELCNRFDTWPERGAQTATDPRRCCFGALRPCLCIAIACLNSSLELERTKLRCWHSKVLLFRQLCGRMGLLFGRTASEGKRQSDATNAELNKRAWAGMHKLSC